METKDLVSTFNKKIVEIYYQEHLKPLRGQNDDYKINGKEILPWYQNVTKHNALKYNLSITYFDLQNDLFFCSDEMIYFTAHLFLYLPFINNLQNDAQQNIEAKRFNMYVDIVSQKAYNFWDRIGDLIASFFPDKIEPNKIFFATAIQSIPSVFHSSQNYIWLNNFKKTEYVKLSQIRKQIVHYTTTDSDYRQKNIKAKNREELERLQKEREKLPEYYKQQIHLTIEGFEKTMNLLEEFNKFIYC